MAHPFHDRQRIEAGRRRVQESRSIEARRSGYAGVGDYRQRLRTEDVLQQGGGGGIVRNRRDP